MIKRLFGRNEATPEPNGPSEHAVLAYIPLSNNEFGSPEERSAIVVLSGSLEEAIADADVGEFDGNESGEGRCTLFMCGLDADLLYAAIDPLLYACDHVKGATVVKRYGAASDPNVREERIEL